MATTRRADMFTELSGLDAEAMARRSVGPSTMSLLGLVRHLAEMESRAFREMMAGQNAPRRTAGDAAGATEPDGDGRRGSPPMTVHTG